MQKRLSFLPTGDARVHVRFVYNASQSNKVEVMEENTGGFIGFGNVLPGKATFYGYTFNNATTKYVKLRRYEFAGIPP